MLGSLITMILGMTVFLSVGTPCVPPKAGQGVDGDLRLSIKLAGRARLRRPVRPGPRSRRYLKPHPRRVGADRPSPDTAGSPPTSIFAPDRGGAPRWSIADRTRGDEIATGSCRSFPCAIPSSRGESTAICSKCCSRPRRQPRLARGDAQRRRTGPTARDPAQTRSSVLLSATATLEHEHAVAQPRG
jgi:hypothetical protein